MDWWPWCDEALALARQSDRPIFLSIGYAACHWCHVMAHESFEDPVTAAALNQDFVSIKVDREERPELDAIYMDAVVAMTGQGGWPLSAFLTPAGEPFFAGTYFPPERRHNLPAFRELLQAIADAWRTDRTRLLDSAQRVVEHLRASVPTADMAADGDPELLHDVPHALFRGYDWTHGGWGGAPKFPQASTAELLLALHRRSGDRLVLDMAVDSLHHMARGGIYDQLGGGFHRYAVDARWLVPHFEKMLYDNALLARAYLHAWQVTADAALLRACQGTLDYLLRDMAHPDGGFFSSEDADSEGEEGTFYLWTQAAFRQALGATDLAELAEAVYGVTAAGSFEGRNILHLPTPPTAHADRFGLTPDQLEARLELARTALFEARTRRVRPNRDEKILTDWNGLLLATLAEAAQALGNPRYLAAAQRLAEFLLSSLSPAGNLLHAWRDGQAHIPAFLKDRAALGIGLLCLYQADFDSRWYSAAMEQAERVLSGFEDPSGGFFDVSSDHERLLFRPMGLQDMPTPSGGALATALLLFLAEYAGEQRFEQAAQRAWRRVQSSASRQPAAFACWLLAQDFALGPRWQLALLGTPSAPDFIQLAEVAARGFHPRLVVAGAPQPLPEGPSILEGRGPIAGRAAAYLCRDFTCDLPTTDPAVLADQLQRIA